jgi:hypothetical protein
VEEKKESELVKTIEGMQSLDECRASIKNIADNIFNDISSTLINSKRIESMRSLIDLFTVYNKQLELKENSE